VEWRLACFITFSEQKKFEEDIVITFGKVVHPPDGQMGRRVERWFPGHYFAKKIVNFLFPGQYSAIIAYTCMKFAFY